MRSFVFLFSMMLLPAATRYDTGTPALTTIWVDPANGADGATGASASTAVRTLREAWNRVPAGQVLSGQGFRILLAPGVYSEENAPVYWEDRRGTFAAPVIIESAEGVGRALMPNVNIQGCRYLYFLGVTIRAAGGDGFHCEQCDHILIRDSQIEGVGDYLKGEGPQETVKFNQSTYVYIENSDIGGAWDNAIDVVAVQYGHLVGNRVHRSNDWCAYLKGGSAYWKIEDNEFFDCGTGGFTAGQGSGYEFMTPPYLHYEAYDVRVVNNYVHDVEGAGLGVNGGFNVLFAYNTLLRTGRRSHTFEAAFGLRTCDGDVEACAARRAQGGWGPVVIEAEDPVPNRNVYFFHNLIVGASGDQHFAIYGPRTDAGAESGIALPVRTDDNLILRGNWIWNGPADHPLGIENEDSGCQPDNPTCNAAQLRAENSINRQEPLLDPVSGRFVIGPTPVQLPPGVGVDPLPVFTNDGRPAGLPVDQLLSTVVTTDRDGQTYIGPRVGAYRLPAIESSATKSGARK